MVECLREIKIKIYIDTNKATYEKEFDNIDEAIEYYNEVMEDL